MKNKKIFLTSALVLAMQSTALAQNPIVQTQLTTDPAPLVVGDRLYVYTGHDEDKADFFWMNEWRIYSTTDMVNWTDHGAPLDLRSFSWADDRAWASQAIERNGKFYWYICAHSKLSGGMAIGVAVSDSPTGPFRDALGKPLFDNGSWDNIDPTVWLDDDGQAYLYWGNPHLYYALLNEDMVSFKAVVDEKEAVDESQTVGRIVLTEMGFGAPDMEKRVKGARYKDCYTEGPWLMKRGRNYYMLYAAGGVPEHIAYAMSKSPLGPWKYKGDIMPLEDTGSFTNHCGVADYKGRSYFFYHTGKLGGGFGRSVAIEEFQYNADGTFPIIHHTQEGVAPIGTLDPYQRNEAETIAFSEGVKTEWTDATGVYISEIHTGDYIKVREVDFGKDAPQTFAVSAASALQGGQLEVHLDSIKGELVASVQVDKTGGWEQFQTFSARMQQPVTGKHDVYFVFKGLKGHKLFSFDWWKFEKDFANPVVWADVPDVDLVRVGDSFYMVSTTMHLMPGAPIMKSKDLVNWETVNYIFPKLTDSPKYDMKEGTAYGRGQWATSLQYHRGKFYALFAPNDNPGGETYICTADDIEGKWTVHSRMRHFHDAALFFDDDDRAYVFYGTGEMVQLNSDLTDVVPGSHRRIFERDADEKGLLEGSRVIKHDGRYYLLMISWTQGHPRREVCYRADSLTGSWEKKVILETEFQGFNGVGQGTIVDAPDGRWYGVIFQDRGGVGRVLTLEPCTWKNGWPMLGDANGDIPQRMQKPVLGYDGKGLVYSDAFDKERLDLQWQWNHNPVDEAWSLTERKGWLRLKTSRIVPHLFLAPNTISTRAEGPVCEAVVRMDVSRMKDGDVAGLSAFQGDAALLSIVKEGKKTYIVGSKESVSLTDKEKAVTEVKREEVFRQPLKARVVYLKMACDFRLHQDLATLSYSMDGKTWTPVVRDFKMVYDYRRLFMGTRFAIYNYATKAAGGYVDVDSFEYTRKNDNE